MIFKLKTRGKDSILAFLAHSESEVFIKPPDDVIAFEDRFSVNNQTGNLIITRQFEKSLIGRIVIKNVEVGNPVLKPFLVDEVSDFYAIGAGLKVVEFKLHDFTMVVHCLRNRRISRNWQW
jgi:hypothetical protein